MAQDSLELFIKVVAAVATIGALLTSFAGSWIGTKFAVVRLQGEVKDVKRRTTETERDIRKLRGELGIQQTETAGIRARCDERHQVARRAGATL